MSRKDIAKDRKNFNLLQFFGLRTFLSSIDCSTLGANVTFLEKRRLYRSNVLCYLQSSVILFVLCSKNNTANNIWRNEIEFWRKYQPSKNLLDLKTSWRRLEDMSWRRLQRVFSVTILRLLRRLEDILQGVFKTCREDILKTCLEDVLKACLEDVLKIGLEDVLKTCLEDVLKISKYLLGISVYF